MQKTIAKKETGKARTVVVPDLLTDCPRLLLGKRRLLVPKSKSKNQCPCLDYAMIQHSYRPVDHDREEAHPMPYRVGGNSRVQVERLATLATLERV